MPYTIQLMNGIQLFQRPLQLQTRTGSNSGFVGQTVTPNPVPFPQGFNPMLSKTSSDSSRFIPASPASPPVTLNPGTREGQNLPYHRSMSQPNFTGSQNSGSESRFKVGGGDIGRDAPGKTQPVLHYIKQRPTVPYTRSMGYDQRYDRNVRNNNMGNQFPHQMMANQQNQMAAILWASNQLAQQRRYWVMMTFTISALQVERFVRMTISGIASKNERCDLKFGILGKPAHATLCTVTVLWDLSARSAIFYSLE